MAALNLPSNKVTISGTIGQAAQTWSTSFWISTGIGTAPTQALVDAYAANVRTPLATFVAAIRGYWSPLVNYTAMKLTHYPAASLVPDFVSSPVVVVQQGAVAAKLPGYCSVVASLRSSSPTRSGRGRMYLPTNVVSTTTDGEMALADVTTIANATAALFTAVNSIAVGYDSGSGIVSVASHHTTLQRPVVRVVVDSKLDVQHRRTNKLGADSVVSATV